MDLQALYDKVVAALTAAGLTEIEIDLKPKTLPTPTVKLFISCQTKASS
jgi:hypothetical protein